MPRLSPERLDQALRLTAERLENLDAPAEAFVVCGGAALLALGLVHRTTRDVDVLDRVAPSSRLIDPRPLSATLTRVADEVSAALDLPQGWLNTRPADPVLSGLPEGFLSRLVRHDHGPRLVVYRPDLSTSAI